MTDRLEPRVIGRTDSDRLAIGGSGQGVARAPYPKPPSWWWFLLLGVVALFCVCCNLDASPDASSTAGATPAASAAADLPCAEQTTWAGSSASFTQTHTYDQSGRLVRTEADYDGDGVADEVQTFTYDEQGRLVYDILDGGQGAPPDGVPDVVRTLFYECSP